MNESGTIQETFTRGALKETFTRGVGLAGDIGTLVAVTHHTGSITNGTFYTHHNHRGDIVLVRSGATTTATYEYSAFGKLTTQTCTDLSRFKFSSKEREAKGSVLEGVSPKVRHNSYFAVDPQHTAPGARRLPGCPAISAVA